MKMLLHCNLLTTDSLAAQAGGTRVCVFYKVVCNLSNGYADDMLRAVILTGVSPLTRSFYVPMNDNKLKK